MNRSETALLLAKAQAFDRRTVGEVDVEAWHEALEDLDPTMAAAAITAHYRESTAWIMPQHIRAHVRGVELQRLRDAGPPDFPNGLDLAGERDYRQLWQEQIRSGATREQATAQADTILGYKRGELVSKPVKELLGSMFSTTGRKS